MKRLLLVLITLLACMSTRAQQFNGVELYGSRSGYVQRYLDMHSSASLIYDNNVGKVASLNHSFLDYQIVLFVAPDKMGYNMVWFDLTHPMTITWNELVAKYNKVLNYFTIVYGQPNKYLTQRLFDHPYSGDNSKGKELQALKAGSVKYTDTIELPNKYNLRISLEYIDSISLNKEYYSISIAFDHSEY